MFYLTISGADEGEAGDDPEKGHADDDVTKRQNGLFIPEPESTSTN